MKCRYTGPPAVFSFIKPPQNDITLLYNTTHDAGYNSAVYEGDIGLPEISNPVRHDLLFN